MLKLNAEQQCVTDVWGANAWRGHQCTRRAVVERDGKRYCKQHDPASVVVKEAARHAAWKLKDAVRNAEWDVVAVEREVTDVVRQYLPEFVALVPSEAASHALGSAAHRLW
ncbi:MAG: hypothetical protein ABI119_13770, partial [Gemmatimonadaceae bacterium]